MNALLLIKILILHALISIHIVIAGISSDGTHWRFIHFVCGFSLKMAQKEPKHVGDNNM
jgi:hypothetical protein